MVREEGVVEAAKQAAGTKVKGGEENGRILVGDVNVFSVWFLDFFWLAFAGLQEKRCTY
jgi:hypothetical protein